MSSQEEWTPRMTAGCWTMAGLVLVALGLGTMFGKGIGLITGGVACLAFAAFVIIRNWRDYDDREP